MKRLVYFTSIKLIVLTSMIIISILSLYFVFVEKEYITLVEPMPTLTPSAEQIRILQAALDRTRIPIIPDYGFECKANLNEFIDRILFVHLSIALRELVDEIGVYTLSDVNLVVFDALEHPLFTGIDIVVRQVTSSGLYSIEIVYFLDLTDIAAMLATRDDNYNGTIHDSPFNRMGIILSTIHLPESLTTHAIASMNARYLAHKDSTIFIDFDTQYEAFALLDVRFMQDLAVYSRTILNNGTENPSVLTELTATYVTRYLTDYPLSLSLEITNWR